MGGAPSASPFCSGTPIAPDVVVTAAHCLTTVRGKKLKTLAPSAVTVYVGDVPAEDLLQHLYAVIEVAPHPTYDPRNNLDDIGVLRLATAVSEPVTPVAHVPAELGLTQSDIGATINFAGFGKTESGSIGVKLQVDLPLAGLGCTVYGCPDGGDAATQISYAQQEAGPCSGDSGGPAFLLRGGTPYVAVVTSYGDPYCVYYGVSTRTDAFDAWLSAFVDYVPPVCEPDGWCNPDCASGSDPDCS